MELAELFLKVLEVPGSAAQAERSISAYNHIIKDKRLNRSPARIPYYVMMYANGEERQERAEVRRRYARKTRRKLFLLDNDAFQPLKKRIRV